MAMQYPCAFLPAAAAAPSSFLSTSPPAAPSPASSPAPAPAPLSLPTGSSTGGWCSLVGRALPCSPLAGVVLVLAEADDDEAGAAEPSRLTPIKLRSTPPPMPAGRLSLRAACLAVATAIGLLMSLMCRSMKTGLSFDSLSFWNRRRGFSSYARHRSVLP